MKKKKPPRPCLSDLRIIACLIVGLALVACTATEVAASSGTIGGAIVDSMVANHHLSPTDGSIFKNLLQSIADLAAAHSTTLAQVKDQVAAQSNQLAHTVTTDQAVLGAAGTGLLTHGVSAARIKPAGVTTKLV
jgi:hypothetical protein